MLCPCCQQALPDTDLLVIPSSHMFFWKGQSVRLTPMELRIVQAVERRQLNIHDLVAALYSDDPDGGPLEAEKTIHVLQSKLNKKLKPLGVRVGSNMRGSVAAMHGIWELPA